MRSLRWKLWLTVAVMAGFSLPFYLSGPDLGMVLAWTGMQMMLAAYVAHMYSVAKMKVLVGRL